MFSGGLCAAAMRSVDFVLSPEHQVPLIWQATFDSGYNSWHLLATVEGSNSADYAHFIFRTFYSITVAPLPLNVPFITA